MASLKLKFRSSTQHGKEGTLFFVVIHRRTVRTVFTDYRISQTNGTKNRHLSGLLAQMSAGHICS